MSQPKHQKHMDTPDWAEHFSLAVRTMGHWMLPGERSPLKIKKRKQKVIQDPNKQSSNSQETNVKLTCKIVLSYVLKTKLHW